jgi:5S rRNA maturation endonuclease (ribonuclease M5)
MVDADHLDEVRTVFLRKGTTSDRLYTSVSHGTEPEGDHDTVLPLQAAVGYELAQTLFLGKQVLIVEGITDYWLLKALNQFHVAQGHTGIPGNIDLIFAGGTSHMLPLVSLFLRPDQTDKRLVVLLDGDKAGLEKAAKLKSDMLHRNGAVALMSDADLLGIPGAQVEDVIDRNELLAAVSLVRPGAKTAPGSFVSNVEFLKAVYVLNGWGELAHAEKARIVLALVDSWRSGSAIPGAKTLANTGKLIDGLVARFGT